MSDPLPILAYATPHGMEAPGGDGEFSMSFAPPPVLPQLVLNLIGLAVCLGAVALFAILGVIGLTSSKRDAPSPLSALIGLAVALPMALLRIVAINRLGRFGKLPVTIDVHDGVVTLVAPQKWKLRPQKLAASNIRECTCRGEAIPVTGPRLYTIRIAHGVMDASEVQVAMSDPSVIFRAVDDLTNAVKMAARIHGSVECESSF